MKAIAYFFFSLLFTPLGTTAKINKEISVKFDKDDFAYNYDETGRLYILSNIYNISFKSNTQEPSLPIVQIGVLIGKNESYENVQIQSEEKIVFEDVLLTPNPQTTETDCIPAHNEGSATITYTKGVYPEQSIQYAGTHILCGYKYVSFLVSPFKYDANEKRLFLRTSMTLSLNLSKTDTKRLASDFCSEDVTLATMISSRLKKLVVNYSQREELYGYTQGSKNRESSLLPGSTTSYEYLIITNNALMLSFQDLANWKTLKGVRSKILTTEQISSQYTGNSLQVKIKNAIKDYYNGTYSGIKYVLLGGDVDIVPSRMCHIGLIVNDTVYNEETTPTDMFYACFDGSFDWDANGNGIFGEINDNVDLLPEVVVSRLPVSTAEQASSYVNRVINYERSPNVNAWKNKMLMGGHALRFWYSGMSDSEVKADSFYMNYIYPYWNCVRKKIFNKQNGDSINLFCRDSLQCELEKGYTFADIITHGMPNCWCMRSIYDYDTNYAQTLTNTGNTIITTAACNTNAFDSPTCLSEAFLRNENSGVLGYLGCSRQGWFNIWPWNLGPSFEYNGEFYKYLFTDSQGMFGKALTDAKGGFAPLCINDSTAYRWIMFGLNLIGDPEMSVYLDVPRRFDNLSISLSNGTLSVNTGENDCTICVSSASGSSGSHYEVQNGATATFSSVLDGYTVCITKPGFIPFVATCCSTAYIQNEIVTGNYNVVSEYVYAGSDVTTSIPQGEVVIQSGNVEIHGKNGVTIKNDFEVHEGSTLKITTGD